MNIETANNSESKQYKERLIIALKAAHVCIFEVDLTRQLYTFFENAEDIFGVSGQQILDDVQPFSKLSPAAYQEAVSSYFSHPDDAEAIDGAFQNVLDGKPATYQARMKAGDSEFVWCKIDVTPILEGGKPVRMVGVVTDISEMKEKTDVLMQKARIDDFTGLFNKTYSQKMVRAALTEDAQQTHALVLMDIDNFKAVNDTYGHAGGDAILLDIAARLKHSFRKTDIIGRFGGDEFILLIKNIQSVEHLRPKLLSLLNRSTNTVYTVSIGAALFPDNATEFNELFRKADDALYHAKQEKNSYMLYAEI